jgi:hypothetical protein
MLLLIYTLNTPSLRIFINFHIPALTPHLISTETLLQLSQNITFFAVCHILYRCHQQRDLDRYQVYVAYHLYIFIYIYIYTIQCWGQDETSWHLCLYIPWCRYFTFDQNSKFSLRKKRANKLD